jgi:hypothetical protein
MRKDGSLMERTEASQEGINTKFVALGRKRFSARIFTLTLLVGLCMTSINPTAYAQTCWEACQQSLVSCLLAAAGDPVQEARCQNNYDKCGQDCM